MASELITAPPGYVVVPNITIMGESASGMAVRIAEEGGKTHWIPLSQVHSQHKSSTDIGGDTIVVKKWIAIEKELDWS